MFSAKTMTYQIARNETSLGTFSEEELRAGMAAGRFQPADWGWREGMREWMPLSAILNLPGASPPPLPPMAAQASPRMEDNAGMRLLMPIGRSGWAIAAGYLGLFALIVLPAPLALIAGIVAVVDIRRSRRGGAPKYGMGRAIFGLVMGAIGTAILVFIVLASVFG